MGCGHAVEANRPIKHFSYNSSYMRTFYVTEIDNVIDIEVDLLWLCYKCAMHLYATIALHYNDIR